MLIITLCTCEWAVVSVCIIRDIVNWICYIYIYEHVLSRITAHTNKYASSLT